MPKTNNPGCYCCNYRGSCLFRCNGVLEEFAELSGLEWELTFPDTIVWWYQSTEFNPLLPVGASHRWYWTRTEGTGFAAFSGTYSLSFSPPECTDFIEEIHDISIVKTGYNNNLNNSSCGGCPVPIVGYNPSVSCTIPFRLFVGSRVGLNINIEADVPCPCTRNCFPFLSDLILCPNASLTAEGNICLQNTYTWTAPHFTNCDLMMPPSQITGIYTPILA